MTSASKLYFLPSKHLSKFKTFMKNLGYEVELMKPLEFIRKAQQGKVNSSGLKCIIIEDVCKFLNDEFVDLNLALSTLKTALTKVNCMKVLEVPRITELGTHVEFCGIVMEISAVEIYEMQQYKEDEGIELTIVKL
ncbi:hypothetical protein [Thermococcus sp.]|uniref:hypothetical protein n=1 Tax=Thermococcus sp. TaxID=35749 RepID=UPI00261B70F6|nr:hypothetical protein [Thermococcus sp.]